MSGLTKADLMAEIERLKGLLASTEYQEPREPNLLETIEQTEREAMQDIAQRIKECEEITGRPLDPHRGSNHVIGITRQIISLLTNPMEVIKVTSGSSESDPDARNQTLRDQLVMCARRAADGSYKWDNSDLFLEWATPILRTYYNNAKNRPQYK